MLITKQFKGRPVIPGYVIGEAIVVESISFYGDVSVEVGALIDGRSIAGKIIVTRRSKGSTVGPYVLYTLKRKGKAPKAIILASRSDPVLVAGAVLANIILVDSVSEEILGLVKDGDEIVVKENGEILLTSLLA